MPHRQVRSRRRPPRRLVPLMLVGLLAALLAGAVGVAPAQADTAADGNTIIGTLLNSAADNAPVEGVEITVTSADGQEY